MSVTVLGLGSMGTSLADAFLKAGHPTTVWNRSAARADALVARGAVRAGSARDAVTASELVVICVTTYDDVHAVRVLSTRSRWSWHTNFIRSLRTSAPGSRCDSQRIWKPLQIPSTGRPCSAPATISVISGENREIAPQRR